MNSQQIANEAHRAKQAADAASAGFTIGQQVVGPCNLRGTLLSVDLKSGFAAIRGPVGKTARAKLAFVTAA